MLNFLRKVVAVASTVTTMAEMILAALGSRKQDQP